MRGRAIHSRIATDAPARYQYSQRDYPRGAEYGDLDPLLAATALEHGLILVTRNVHHFEHVPQLIVENWFVNAWYAQEQQVRLRLCCLRKPNLNRSI